MTAVEFKSRPHDLQNKLRERYSKLSKFILIIGILLVLFAFIIFLGARVLNYGYDWAYLSVENWILIILAIIVVLIILEIIFYMHFYSSRDKKHKDEFRNGQKVHVFTYPQGMEGGIFSKTYVDIDENNALRLRTLIIPPEDIWGNK